MARQLSMSPVSHILLETVRFSGGCSGVGQGAGLFIFRVIKIASYTNVLWIKASFISGGGQVV